MDWYYYNEHGEKIGTFSVKQIHELVSKGVIKRDTMLENSTGKQVLAGTTKGLVFPPESPPEPVVNTEQSESVPVEQTPAILICNACGKEIPRDSSFCPFCGTKTDSSPTNKTGRKWYSKFFSSELRSFRLHKPKPKPKTPTSPSPLTNNEGKSSMPSPFSGYRTAIIGTLFGLFGIGIVIASIQVVNYFDRKEREHQEQQHAIQVSQELEKLNAEHQANVQKIKDDRLRRQLFDRYGHEKNWPKQYDYLK
jgi:hypothetical protein